MHRTHMGVDNDWVSILLHGLRNALSDGWGGSMIATDVSDILFGTPQPAKSTVNVGVLKTGPGEYHRPRPQSRWFPKPWWRPVRIPT